MTLKTNVAVYHDETLISYHVTAPFSPGTKYPEYEYDDAGCADNQVYDAVRNCLALAGLDRERFGTVEWNPFGSFIRPGQTVLIKPNCVLDFHGWGWDIESVITHASIIRAVADYAIKALKGRGRLIIGDAPLQSANFDKIRTYGLASIEEYFQRCAAVPVEVKDFRREHAFLDSSGNIIGKQRVVGEADLSEHCIVEMGSDSMFAPVSHLYQRYRVTNYDPDLMPKTHNQQRNAYLVARPVLDADVIIGLPKLKTHRKAGMTCALKNQIGINGQKDWLPHHRRGAKPTGGDEYLHRNAFKALADTLVEREDVVTSRILKRILRYGRAALYHAGKPTYKDRFHEGSWYGNDTIWRTLIDLNRVLLYADKDGILRDRPQRATFFLVDAIIAGDHEGPLEPTAKPCGMLLAAASAPLVDAVAARLMGFDFRRIPSIREAFLEGPRPLASCRPEEVKITSNLPKWELCDLVSPGASLDFVPSLGWQGHIELVPKEGALDGPGALPENAMLTYRGVRLP